MAQEIQLLKLEDDRITANGANVLAFEAGIDWDIKRVEGASGALAGGLYNMEFGRHRVGCPGLRRPSGSARDRR